MNKKQEEQFDKRFPEKDYSFIEHGFEVENHQPKDRLARKQLKQFISQIKAETRQEIVEEIEKMRKYPTGHESIGIDGFIKGYNQAIKDIIKTLK